MGSQGRNLTALEKGRGKPVDIQQRLSFILAIIRIE